jgi:hypothetical protein
MRFEIVTDASSETYTYQIPKCIQNGEYLLRVQQLAIHNPWPAGIPQFYISCGKYPQDFHPIHWDYSRRRKAAVVYERCIY